jgi:hypothetical protein
MGCNDGSRGVGRYCLWFGGFWGIVNGVVCVIPVHGLVF